MAYRTATFDGGACIQGRGVASGIGRRALRATLRHLALGVAAAATVAVIGAAVILAALWFISSATVSNPYLPGHASKGPGRLTLAGLDPAATGSIPSFETKWVRSQGSHFAGGGRLIVAVPESAPVLTAKTTAVEVASLEAPKAAPVMAPVLPPMTAPTAVPLAPVPLARSVPAHLELARRTAPQPASTAASQKPSQLAALAPPQEAHNREPALSDSTSRTAVYDITTSTVYMPNGQKLEAHSGLHDKMDDPRHIKLRMRGPTPPNVYVLTERESLFHGVRAIRLNPVDRDKMYGRDGMLAHSYMLGPNGQSNGCVSFKNYDKFLQAFLDGKVDKLVVVADLGKAHWKTAALQAEGVNVPARRFASPSSRRSRYATFFGDEPAYSPANSYPALGYAPSEGN